MVFVLLVRDAIFQSKVTAQVTFRALTVSKTSLGLREEVWSNHFGASEQDAEESCTRGLCCNWARW